MRHGTSQDGLDWLLRYCETRLVTANQEASRGRGATRAKAVAQARSNTLFDVICHARRLLATATAKPSAEQTSSSPIPLRLPCPTCSLLHIDKGELATKPHHTHACQGCGNVWRPAVVHTVGVRFLPGFKNDEQKPDGDT